MAQIPMLARTCMCKKMQMTETYEYYCMLQLVCAWMPLLHQYYRLPVRSSFKCKLIPCINFKYEREQVFSGGCRWLARSNVRARCNLKARTDFLVASATLTPPSSSYNE